MLHFDTPWKYQKTRGFMTFSRGIEMEPRTKIGFKVLWVVFGNNLAVLVNERNKESNKGKERGE